MNVILPLLSTIVSLVFATTVLVQYASRRKPHQLIWGLGLLMYGLGAFSEVLAGAVVWNEGVYKLWYLCGAILTAAYLGMGTIYLLVPRRTANVVMAVLAAASLLAVIMLLGADANLQQVSRSALTGAGLPGNVRVLTPFFNIFGSAALILGAAYSAWIFWRKHIHPERVVSNVLIAAGGFCPALGGSLQRLNIQDVLYMFELLGIVLIFAGFLANYEVIASRFAYKAKPAIAGH